MGLFDFFKKGEEKPVQPTTKSDNNFFKQNSTTQSGAAPAAGQKEYYTVKSGDSLSKIAKQLYGDANAWHKIHQANTDQITDPNLIHPGQKFVIPR